ncbi:hypothetical protein ACFX2B_013160 [Malus domestica]
MSLRRCLNIVVSFCMNLFLVDGELKPAALPKSTLDPLVMVKAHFSEHPSMASENPLFALDTWLFPQSRELRPPQSNWKQQHLGYDLQTLTYPLLEADLRWDLRRCPLKRHQMLVPTPTLCHFK